MTMWTHMVGYPKLKMFLGNELLSEIPSRVRKADDLYDWISKEYDLVQEPKESEL